MRCVMLFCLSTGAALDVAMAPYRGKQTGENSLLQTLIGLLFPGDILLADRYYATFGNMHRAIAGGYDVVMRAHHKRKIDFRRGFKQGSYDQIVAYLKPARRPTWMSLQEYRDCDTFILVRHVSYEVKRKGFRARNHLGDNTSGSATLHRGRLSRSLLSAVASGTGYSQLENSHANGASAVQEPIDGSQGNLRASDRLQPHSGLDRLHVDHLRHFSEEAQPQGRRAGTECFFEQARCVFVEHCDIGSCTL